MSHVSQSSVSSQTSTKEILALALPISLALAIPQISFLTNTIFLGRLGEQELGINGIAGIFYLTLAMIGYGLANGVQVQLSRRAGEKNNAGLAETAMNGGMLAVLFAAALILITAWLAPIIFGSALRSEENTTLSINYLFVRIWGLPFLMLTQIFNAFFISIGKSRFLIYGSIAATAATILADYALIFGNFGFPPLGLMGAAYAAIFGEVVSCVTLLIIFFVHRVPRTYPVGNYLRFNPQLSRRSLAVAAPLIVQFLFSIGGWQVFFIYIEHLGDAELAASQILRSIFGVVGIGAWAMASTCNAMVSNVIGAGRQNEVMSLIAKIVKLSLVYSIAIGALLFIFDEQFLGLYRDDAALISLAKPSLRVIVLATVIMSIATVVFNGVLGTGNTMVNLTIEISCVILYLIYCSIVIERMKLSLAWAWGSEFLYWSSLLLIAWVYLRSGRWRNKVI